MEGENYNFQNNIGQQPGMPVSPQNLQQPQQQMPPLANESLTWEAHEFVHQDKSVRWFVLAGAGGAVVTISLYWISKSITSSLFIALFAGLFVVLSSKKPKLNKYVLNENGISVNQKYYNFDDFISFSIIDDQDRGCIWLKPARRITPTIALYYPDELENDIIDLLADILPHEERELDRMDRFARRLKL